MTAVTLIFRRRLLAAVASFLDNRSDSEIALLTVALGAVLGVLVSISSVGAGAIGVTVLLMLYPKMPTVRIVGTDIAHAVPLTLLAGAGHWWLGSVDWLLLVSLLFGSIPGIAIGSHVASRVPEQILRPLMAGTLALVGGSSFSDDPLAKGWRSQGEGASTTESGSWFEGYPRPVARPFTLPRITAPAGGASSTSLAAIWTLPPSAPWSKTSCATGQSGQTVKSLPAWALVTTRLRQFGPI